MRAVAIPFHWAEASGLCSKPNELDNLSERVRPRYSNFNPYSPGRCGSHGGRCRVLEKGVQLAWVSIRWPISPIHDTNSRLRPGDADMETSPATDGAFYPDAPIVGLDDTLADRQPQSRASPRTRIVTCAEAMQARDGRWLEGAGLVLVRQRPGSAKGVMFITLEDETGIANLVVWPQVFEKFRRTVMAASMRARPHPARRRGGASGRPPAHRSLGRARHRWKPRCGLSKSCAS
jgi:hypothetical protein